MSEQVVDIDRDALDAQNEGRGLCRVLVWAAVAAWVALAEGAYESQSTRFVTTPNALFPMGTKDVGKIIPAIAWYKLDGNALDSSGNGYTGTVTDAVVTNGVFGQGYYFGGVAAVISRATSQSLVNGASGTVCFWMRADSLEQKYIWSMFQHGNAFLWARRELDGRVSARLYQGSQAFWVYSTGTYSAGTWVHVAFRWGVNGWKISINGAPEGTDADTTAVNLGASTMTIGAQYPGIPMDGSMDDVRIYNRALSAANIARIMSSGDKAPLEELQ